MTIYKKGNSGPQVLKIQQALGLEGPTGRFGPITEQAVKNYQQAHGQVDR